MLYTSGKQILHMQGGSPNRDQIHRTRIYNDENVLGNRFLFTASNALLATFQLQPLMAKERTQYPHRSSAYSKG